MIKKRDLSICYLLKESASMLEQTSSSYGGLKLGLFLTKWGPFAQFQRAPFGKSSQQDGNETLIFKRFRLFWSRFDSSDWKSPSKYFLLSNFDDRAYHLAGFSKRLSTVTNTVSREPPPPLPILPVPSSYKNGSCLNIRTSLDILDNIHPRKQPLACVFFD